MICEAYFYNLPFDKGSNIRIMTSSALVSIANSAEGSQSQKAKKIVLNLPSNFDRVATFYADVPTDGYPIECNYAIVNAPLGTDRRTCRFWITRPESVANDKGVLRIYFERDPIPDVSRSVKGVFSALPTLEKPYQRQTVSDDLIRSRKINLPNIGALSITIVYDTETTTYDSKLFWVEVTTNRSIKNNNTDPQRGALREAQGLFRYGLFVSIDHNYERSPKSMAPGSVYFDNTHTYMSFDDLINKLSAMAKNETFTDANILDISVSERCPFEHRTFINNTYYAPGAILHDGRFDIDNKPTEVWNGGYAYEINRFVSYYPDEQEITVTSSDLETCYGNRILYDAVGNIAATLPVTKEITLKVKCISDFSNMYTVVYNDDLGLRYILPEGHLPFGGDNWTTYSRLALNYDREMMSINQQKANADAANSVGTGIANGLLSGALLSNPVIGIATAGVSIGSSMIGRGISIKAEKDAQKAKEKNQLIQAGTTYNVAYGVSYMFNATLTKGAHIDVMMPVNMSENDLLENVKIYGYPAVGLRTVTLSKGYYQGYVIGYSNNGNIDKLVLSILNDELSQGIRIIESRDDI